MQTDSKQTKAMLVNIESYVKDFNNPIIKAFKQRGSVFGFAAYFIVADMLGLTQAKSDNIDLLVDNNGKTYKVFTTTDVCPAFSKGYGRSKDSLDFKTLLVNQSDYLVILEPPKEGSCIMTMFKTTDVVLNEKGILQ